MSRELEHELVPLCLDQGVGILVWSPLSGGFLTGKVRRDRAAPEGSRQSVMGPPGGLADPEGALDVVEALVEIAAARGREPGAGGPQLAARQARGDLPDRRRPDRRAARPTTSPRATGAWTPAEVERLDALSAPRLPYPQWHQLLYNSARATEPWLLERVARG